MNIGGLMMTLGVDSTGLRRAEGELGKFEKSVQESTSRINSSFQRVGESMMEVGGVMTAAVTLPLAGIAAGAVAMHKGFESSMTQIIGLVGVAEDQVAGWSKDLIEMAPQLGKTPKELADGLFFVTSAGHRGEKALKLLELSAKGAAAGLGDTKTIAHLASSAMNAYGYETLNSSQAMDILVATVREGKLAPAELAQSMASVIPVASQLGVGFDQVGAALAAMSRTGANASEASTALRSILVALTRTTDQQEEAFSKIGVTSEELRDMLKGPGGLISVLSFLHSSVDGNSEALSRMFPDVQGLTGVMNLMGGSVEDTIGIFERMKESTGSLDHAFEAISSTVQFKWDQALAANQAALVALGDALKSDLIPILERVTEVVSRVVEWFTNLSNNQQQVIIRIGMVVAAIGPLTLGLGYLATNVLPGLLMITGKVTAGFKALGAAMKKNPAIAVAYGIGILVAALIPLIARKREATIAQDELNNAMDRMAKGNVEVVSGINRQIQQLDRLNERQTGELLENIRTAIQREEDAILEYERLINEQGTNQLQFAKKWLAKREKAFELWDQIGAAYEAGQVQEGARLSSLRNQVIKELDALEQLMTRDTMRLVMDTDERSWSQAHDRLNKLKHSLFLTEERLKGFTKETVKETTVTGKATASMLSEIISGLEKELEFIDKLSGVMGEEYDRVGAKINAIMGALQQGLRIEGIDSTNQQIQGLIVTLSHLDEEAKMLEGMEIKQGLMDELARASLMYGETGDKLEYVTQKTSLYKSAIKDLTELFPAGSNSISEYSQQLDILNKQQEDLQKNLLLGEILNNLQRQLEINTIKAQILGAEFDLQTENITAYQSAWENLISSGFKPGTEAVDEVINKFILLREEQEKIQEQVRKMGEIYREVANVAGQSMTNVFSLIGEGLVKNKQDFHAMAGEMISGIQRIINSLLAQAIAGMIAGEVSTKAILGLATAAIGVAALKAMWAANVPQMAKGGIVSGRTLVEVGEYSGVKANPEVIAPLKDLRNLIGEGSPVSIELKIAGPDLYAVWKKEHDRRRQFI